MTTDVMTIAELCRRLERFLMRKLPPTQRFSMEVTVRMSASFGQAAQLLEEGGSHADALKLMCSEPRVLADEFGVATDHPIMGPFTQLSGPVFYFMSERLRQLHTPPPVPPYPLPGEE